MSQFKPPVYSCLCVESHLLEENRKITSDLQITENIFVNFNDLLCFTEIGNSSLVINSSVKIPRTSFLCWSSWYKKIFDLGSLVKDLETTDKSLDDWSFPIRWYLKLIYLFKKISVPNKMIRLFMMLLMRQRESKLILVREVKSMF